MRFARTLSGLLQREVPCSALAMPEAFVTLYRALGGGWATPVPPPPANAARR